MLICISGKLSKRDLRIKNPNSPRIQTFIVTSHSKLILTIISNFIFIILSPYIE